MALEAVQYPSAAHALLNTFAGRWRTSGRVKGSHGEMLELSGSDVYEWLPGRHFLEHRVNVRIGDEPVYALEIIGVDKTSGLYFMQAFDNQGNVEEMQASCESGIWRFRGAALRFRGSFSNEGRTLSGDWEQRTGDHWHHLMSIVLEKE